MCVGAADTEMKQLTHCTLWRDNIHIFRELKESIMRIQVMTKE